MTVVRSTALRPWLAVALWSPALVVTASAAAEAGPAAAAAGTTILGEQDAAVGLYLAPWKNEEPAEIGRAPGLHDEAATPLNGQDFERTQSYYATGRAWRTERLQKNR